ncbi:MAG: hypothetical protein P1V97_39295 [Planctomycetota bacterium]|nr:hypothetical protein [Planctomycetota bacterium]
MDQKRNILFGKLAILRGFLSREHASECFQLVAQNVGRGQSTNLWEITVSRGYMSMDQAQMIIKIMDHGQLICPQACPVKIPLTQFPAEKSFNCEHCQAALRIVPINNQERPNNVPSDTDPALKVPQTPSAPSIPSGPSTPPPAIATPPPIVNKAKVPTTTSATNLLSGQVFGPFHVVKAVGTSRLI